MRSRASHARAAQTALRDRVRTGAALAAALLVAHPLRAEGRGDSPDVPIEPSGRPIGRSLGSDLVGTLEHTGHGFVRQFTGAGTLLLLAGGIGVTSAVVATEDSYQEDIERADVLGPTGRRIGDIAGVVLAIPTVPIAVYVWGRVADDERLALFATELAATHFIVQLETLGISQIPIHARPIVERGEIEAGDQNFFNRVFRGPSSMPSGHVGGVAALAFKGFQHYGWSVGVPATLATVFIGWARVEEGQHWLSDIVGTIALAGVASCATSETRAVWRLSDRTTVTIQPTATKTSFGIAAALPL